MVASLENGIGCASQTRPAIFPTKTRRRMCLVSNAVRVAPLHLKLFYHVTALNTLPAANDGTVGWGYGGGRMRQRVSQGGRASVDASIERGCIHTVAPAHSPQSPRCCAPRAREQTGTRTRCDAAEGESRRAGAGSRRTRDDVDASPLVPLLLASILRVRDELLSSSLL